MGGIVADQLQRARIIAGDEFDFGVTGNRISQIADHAIKGHGHGALGQRGRNPLGNIETRYAGGKFTDSPVGKG